MTNLINNDVYSSRGNTSRVFAVLINNDVNQEQIDEFKDFIRMRAKENTPKDVQYSQENGSDLFSYKMSNFFGDVDVKIVAKMVSGYKYGHSLDFEFKIEGMKDNRDIEVWVDKSKDKLIALTERMFDKVSSR